MKYAFAPEPFLAAGFSRSEFFRHEVLRIPKQYPDTYLLLRRRGLTRRQLRSGTYYQINLYSPDLDGFADELFWDPTVNWHEQQFGKKGLIAAAGVFLKDREAFITVLQSDLCQQLFRSPSLKAESKTQVDKRFGHWYKLLANAILDFAVDLGLAAVYFPTARQILSQTRKCVAPNLFRRVYDFAGSWYPARAVPVGPAEYWRVRPSESFSRIARLERQPVLPRRIDRTVICLFHDIEEDVDTEVSRASCEEDLRQMLRIEKTRGVRTTYNILGRLWTAKAATILSQDRHCLAFHSYNHRIEELDQLPSCRQVDLRVKGYRPPRSRITPELSDYNLSFYNFEWLLSSELSLGLSGVTLRNGLVLIPAKTDDHPVYRGRLSYDAWEQQVLDFARRSRFLAVGLHDCYASVWISRYASLLDRLLDAGELWTCDQVINHAFWESAEGSPGLCST